MSVGPKLADAAVPRQTRDRARSLIATARLNDVDPQAWLAEVLARIAGHPAQALV